MSDNRLAKALFQLAICGGSLAVPQDLVPKDKVSSEKTKREDKPTTSLPSEGIHNIIHIVYKLCTWSKLGHIVDNHFLLYVSVKVKQYLKDSLSSQNATFTLAHMASLEKKLIKHFQVKDFLSLEQGNFLEFVVKHIQVKRSLI